jgi:translocation and assembly module TamB
MPRDTPSVRHRAPRWPWVLLGLIGLTLTAALVLPFTLLGTRVLLHTAEVLLPELKIRGIQGALGERMTIDELDWELSGGRRIRLERIETVFSNLHLGLGRFARLQFASVTAARLRLPEPAPGPSTAIDPPLRLELPVSLEIDHLALARLDLPGSLAPLEDLQARLRLEAGAGARHQADRIGGRWAYMGWQDATASIDSSAPLALQLDARLATLPQQHQVTPWTLTAQVAGRLAAFRVSGDLQAFDQSLQLQADLTLFGIGVVPRLAAQARNFDLALLDALAPGLPSTALTGQIEAEIAPLGAMRVKADVVNPRAARSDAAGLPVRQLQLDLASRFDDVSTGTIRQFNLVLGSDQQPAGRVSGRGSWGQDGQHLSFGLETRLDRIRPAEIDRRAPAFEISGPLALSSVLAWPPQPASLRSDQPLLALHSELSGQRLDAPQQPAVSLTLDGHLSPRHLHLEQLLARAGATELEASGTFDRQGREQQLGLHARVRDFDPRVWWPGLGMRLGSGPTRLSGRIETDLHQTSAAAGSDPSFRDEMLSHLSGQADIRLEDSVLAGLPFTLLAHIDAPRPSLSTEAAPPGPVRFDAEAGVGPANGSMRPARLVVSGRVDPDPRQDHWKFEFDSPQLQVMQPWLNLLGSPAQIRGDLQSGWQLDGRWPQMHGQGRMASTRVLLDADGTDAQPGLELQQLSGQLRLGTDPDEPFDLDLGWARAEIGTRHLLDTRLSSKGSLRRHTVELSTVTDAGRPPAWLLDPPAEEARASVAAGPASNRLKTRLTVLGSWSALGSETFAHWSGRVSQLNVRDDPDTGGPDWVLLEPTTVHWYRLATDPESAPAGQQTFVIEPTRMDLASAHLRLDQAELRLNPAHPERPQLRLRGRLEPLALAPLLARAQPGFGWRGDLTLAGEGDLNLQTDRLDARFRFGRTGGDLLVLDPDAPVGPQPLGLSDLSLSLSAERGHWRLDQHISGGNLGSLEGSQELRSSGIWPRGSDPVNGQIDLHVAQLGYWGRWLPPGWRLSGRLDTQARLGGRLGAPELSGELRGHQIGVQNALQGVDWRDAELHATLQGDTARIDTCTIKAGNGQISAIGEARLGASPQLQLRAQADRFALLQRIDRRVVTSGEIGLVLDRSGQHLRGMLRADEGRIDISQSDAPSRGDDIVLDGEAAVTEGQRTPNPAPAAQNNTDLDVRLDLGEAFYLQGRGLSTRLAGQLQLLNPGGRTSLTGRITTEDGTFNSYGQKLAIDRGLITFTGSPSNPTLDIEATRPDIDEVRVGVAVTGTAQNMRVRLFSDPALNDTDKLSWLILGRAPDGLGRTDLALLQRAAYALISGEGDNPSLIQRLGVDQLSVRQSDGEVRETVVSLGKQLSRRWYIGYERNLNAATGAWQLIYRIAQRFTLRAQSGADRALDLIWTWRWRPDPPPEPETPTPTPEPAAPPPSTGLTIPTSRQQPSP